MKRRIAVRGIVFKDGKLLGLKLKDYHNTGVKNDYWCTPGGGLDVGEDLLLGLSREMIEETGIKPVIGNLLYIQQFELNNVEQLEFFFHIANPDAYETLDLDATTHGTEEIDEYDFVDPKTNHVLPKFLTERDIQADIDSGAPTQVLSYL